MKDLVPWCEDIRDFLDSLSTSNKDHESDLFLKTWHLIRELEKELEKVKDGRENLEYKALSELIDDLLITVKHPVFIHFFAGKKSFTFNYDSLMDIVPVNDPSEIFFKIFEFLYFLPKDDTTAIYFEDGLACNIDYFSRTLEPRCIEHQWVLDCGFAFRVDLAYSHIPKPEFCHSYSLIINRNILVKDSISKIIGTDSESLAKGVSVRFEDENGEGDGVLRDWLISLIRAMVDDDDAFQHSGDDLAKDCTRIYPKQGAVKDLNFYRCFGRLLALALMHKIQIGITLDKTLFQQFAENDINLEDIRETDPGKFLSYSQIIFSSEECYEDYCLFYPDSPDGKKKDDKPVAYEDREEYLATLIREQFVDSIKAQTEKIIEGVDDIISCPKRTEIFQIIRLEDLDCMIRGILELSMEDWIKSTSYEGYKENDPVIMWFWQCVADLSEERKRKLLFFWSATTNLPLGGFKFLDPRLVIRNLRTEESCEHLPVASTCLGTLTFPPYLSYDVMLQKLLLVIDHAGPKFELQ